MSTRQITTIQVRLGRLPGGGRARPAAVRRAVLLDPLRSGTYGSLGNALFFSRHFKESIAARESELALGQEGMQSHAMLGLAYHLLGDTEHARASCETHASYWLGQECLAIVYDKQGMHADAERMYAKLRASWGDDAAFQYAEINAQWGDVDQGLHWLDTAVRFGGAGLEAVKTDPLLDPLRKESRFQAIERALKFPVR